MLRTTIAALALMLNVSTAYAMDFACGQPSAPSSDADAITQVCVNHEYAIVLTSGKPGRKFFYRVVKPMYRGGRTLVPMEGAQGFDKATPERLGAVEGGKPKVQPSIAIDDDGIAPCSFGAGNLSVHGVLNCSSHVDIKGHPLSAGSQEITRIEHFDVRKIPVTLDL